MILYQSDLTDEQKRQILLTYSFKEVINDKNLVLTLLQLAKNYFNFNHSTCKKDHLLYYNKLKTLKT